MKPVQGSNRFDRELPPSPLQDPVGQGVDIPVAFGDVEQPEQSQMFRARQPALPAPAGNGPAALGGGERRRHHPLGPRQRRPNRIGRGVPRESRPARHSTRRRESPLVSLSGEEVPRRTLGRGERGDRIRIGSRLADPEDPAAARSATARSRGELGRAATVGDRSSATTRPRSVTRMVSPRCTSLSTWLSRALRSRTPTVCIAVIVVTQ